MYVHWLSEVLSGKHWKSNVSYNSIDVYVVKRVGLVVLRHNIATDTYVFFILLLSFY